MGKNMLWITEFIFSLYEQSFSSQQTEDSPTGQQNTITITMGNHQKLLFLFL